MIGQLETLMSALGGAGMKLPTPSNTKKHIDDFNKTTLDLALKLDNAYGLQNAKTMLNSVVMMCKVSAPTMIDGYLKVTSKHGTLIEKKDKAFWTFFPLKINKDFDDIDKENQDALWRYAAKLNRISSRYKGACEENPVNSMGGLDMNSICGDSLTKLKRVLKKHGIEKKNFVAFATDVASIMPIEELMSALPTDMIPGIGDVNPSEMSEQVIKTAAEVLFTDTTIEAVMND
jgi:hypothetical protein